VLRYIGSRNDPDHDGNDSDGKSESEESDSQDTLNKGAKGLADAQEKAVRDAKELADVGNKDEDGLVRRARIKGRQKYRWRAMMKFRQPIGTGMTHVESMWKADVEEEKESRF
jgi:hypothetical protein